MDEALRVFLIALLSAGTMAVTAWGLIARARGQFAQQFEKQELARQEQINERERQINASLQEFRTLFAQERLLRINRDDEVSSLKEKVGLQTGEIGALQREQRHSLETINVLDGQNKALLGAQEADRGRILALEEDKRDQTRRIRELNQRIEKVEQERDAALTLVDTRNGELAKANESILRLEIDLASTQGELEAMVKRIVALEKKPGTGELNAAALPDGIEPGETSFAQDAGATHETEKNGDITR